MMNELLNADLQTYVKQVTAEFDEISDERKEALEKIASYVQQKKKEGNVELTFICTHNSRRSHMSQVWAQIAAYYYGIDNVYTYSGGTEATAFNTRAVNTLQQAGLHINAINNGDNPVYKIKYAESVEPIQVYSKVYNADKNPSKGFAAIMTCSQADQNCPFIPGATRFAIPYEDPKAYDGTANEASAYQECCRQIAREMFYLFSKVN